MEKGWLQRTFKTSKTEAQLFRRWVWGRLHVWHGEWLDLLDRGSRLPRKQKIQLDT